MMRRSIAAAVLCFAIFVLRAEEMAPKPLTLEDVERVNFSGNPLHGLTWFDAENYLQRKAQLMKVNAASGDSVPFYDIKKMEAALVAIPGMDPKTAKSLANNPDRMNPSRTGAILRNRDSLYYYYFGADAAITLSTSFSDTENLSFSPDGKQLSFIRNSNLHVLDTATGNIKALTTDGNAKLLNGKLDWVYQEEVYGRGDFKGHWWSPDSKRIAFLQLDENPVKSFTVVDHISHYQNLEVESYPKSGTPNPTVKLGIVEILSGKLTWVDLSKYSKDEPIIARVGWTPDSTRVNFLICNRVQTWMDINLANCENGKSETLFRETTGAWIEIDHTELPRWLKDGSFLFLSERNGFRHLYQYAASGQLMRQITSGHWEVRKFHGIDEAAGILYFSGTEHSPIGSDCYRVNIDGSALTRLTQSEGTHSVSFNTSLTQFIDTWSDINTPPQTRLYKSDGSLLRVLDENKVSTTQKYRWSTPEFLHVNTRDGFVMEAMMIKPPDFDPSKKYPVWSHTYSGPRTSSVHNAWHGGGAWHQYLAQKGYVIWICDNRSASGKGAQSAWTSYKQLGVQELKDLEDGVKYLKSLPYIDGQRIGLDGWSFGGFMTAFAMTHSNIFKVGIAGAGVMDWSLYDTIYTERYMLTPQNNPDGYARGSVINAAKNLSGKLLLIHGTMDDNVHMQNTMQLIYEFQKAGKQFDLMLYPKSRHGVGDPGQSKHLRELMTKYILDNL